ncbi:FkbM family methyltransferase [Chloroflexi bacterium TSY]|nr:FkbM family methyltransferase [Chloroflexi bacterium TSY]
MKQQMGKILRKLTAVCGYSLDRKPRAILRDRSRELAVTLDLLVAHLLTRQDQCIFVQIGAYDGISVDPMHPIIVKYGLQGVLVAPQPDAYAELCQTYAGTSGLELVNVAVAEQDGTRTLYRIKRRAEIPQGLHQLATFDRALLVRQLKMIGNVQAEIEEIFVPCLMVDQLLKRAGLGRVDLLYIDAEGYDYAIVKQFDVANRKPQIIGFEHRWLRSSELNECVDFLIFHGYKVAVDQQDTLAYRC